MAVSGFYVLGRVVFVGLIPGLGRWRGKFIDVPEDDLNVVCVVKYSLMSTGLVSSCGRDALCAAPGIQPVGLKCSSADISMYVVIDITGPSP